MPKAKRQTKIMQEEELTDLFRGILSNHLEPEEMPEAVDRALTLCEELGYLEDVPESAQAAS